VESVGLACVAPCESMTIPDHHPAWVVT